MFLDTKGTRHQRNIHLVLDVPQSLDTRQGVFLSLGTQDIRGGTIHKGTGHKRQTSCYPVPSVSCQEGRDTGVSYHKGRDIGMSLSLETQDIRMETFPEDTGRTTFPRDTEVLLNQGDTTV